ncbi:MAG: proline--tRNA ligase [Bryobacterales bacterium]|nr:proline--tRNA ligase [Bryobacterales bacterium]
MYWSKLFIPTLREVPAEAEVASHRLMLRAGYVRQLSAGIYSYLLLAQRSLLKIQKIIREEMEAIGAQEMFLPALNPADVWQESGRWDVMGDNMFRLKDRFGRDLCLGMTHEEVMTSIARGELNTYRQLPQIWYQIQTKFRDEPRPRSGLLRTRQFTMKDSYSFDLDAAGLDAAYRIFTTKPATATFTAACEIRSPCSLEAQSAPCRASQSHEFMVLSEAGEDFVAVCKETGYAANLEKAVSLAQPPAQADVEGDLAPEEFHTPAKKTIAEVAAFTGLPESSQMKSLVMMADEKPLLVLLRGDHSLSETKLEGFTGARDLRQALPHEIREWFGADAGSLGPIGVANMRIVADDALKGRRIMASPAAPIRTITIFETSPSARISRPSSRISAKPWRGIVPPTARAYLRCARPWRSATSSSWATSIPNRWDCGC